MNHNYEKVEHSNKTTIYYYHDYIVKKVKLFNNNGIYPGTINEISVLSYINHPNIIKLKSFEIDNNKIRLKFPKRKCTLSKLIDDIKLDQNLLKKYVYNIACGLVYLHTHNIIHRDLKPQNIVYNEKKDRLEIIDFDSSKFLYGKYEILTDNMVTLNYSPPESLLGHNKYDTSIDIWSFGCIIYKMLTGTMLFNNFSEHGLIYDIAKILGSDDIKKMDINNKYSRIKKYFGNDKYFESKIYNNCSIEWIKLLKGMIQIDPSKRLSAYDIINSPLFVNFENKPKIRYISLLDNYYLRKLPINKINDNNRSKHIHLIWEELKFLNLTYNTLFMSIYIFDKVYILLKNEEGTNLIISCIYIASLINYYDSINTYADIYDISIPDCKRIIKQILVYIKFDLVYATSYNFLIEYGKLYNDYVVKLAIDLLLYFEIFDDRIFEWESHDRALWALYHSTKYYEATYHNNMFKGIENIIKIKNPCTLTDHIKNKYNYDLIQF